MKVGLAVGIEVVGTADGFTVGELVGFALGRNIGVYVGKCSGFLHIPEAAVT